MPSAIGTCASHGSAPTIYAAAMNAPGGFERLRGTTTGVNRISIGLQSASDVVLAALSRIHKRADFEAAFRAAREAGKGTMEACEPQLMDLKVAASLIDELIYHFIEHLLLVIVW